MSTPSEHVAEEPQEERGAPGSRDTGADRPSAGPADRPSGTYEGDESVPTYGDEEKPEFDTRMTERPPNDAEPAVPPYEGRKEAAEPVGSESEREGARNRWRHPAGCRPRLQVAIARRDTRRSTASPASEQSQDR